jgi:hypothetical protein
LESKIKQSLRAFSLGGVSVFINFSNHPSANWSEAQLAAALQYGKIMDIPFPAVDPTASTKGVAQTAGEYLRRINELAPKAVLCQGEFTLTFF